MIDLGAAIALALLVLAGLVLFNGLLGRRGVVVFAALLAIGIGVFLLGVRKHGRPSHKATARLGDLQNLVQIGSACRMFAADHGGRFPDDWSQLAPYTEGDATMFVARESGARAGSMSNVMDWTSFVYCPGVTTASPPTTVVAYLPLGHYKSPGTVVLFADGHGIWLNAADFEGIMQPTPSPAKPGGP